MYTGPLKRLRKRDLTPAGVSFSWIETKYLRDVEISLESGGKKSKIVDTLEIAGCPGDVLTISMLVTLRDKKGKIVSSTMCALIPTDRLPVYFVNDKARH